MLSISPSSNGFSEMNKHPKNSCAVCKWTVARVADSTQKKITFFRIVLIWFLREKKCINKQKQSERVAAAGAHRSSPSDGIFVYFFFVQHWIKPKNDSSNNNEFQQSWAHAHFRSLKQKQKSARIDKKNTQLLFSVATLHISLINL